MSQGPDPVHPSDKECSSDEDKDSSDKDNIEGLYVYVDPAWPARVRVQDLEIVEVL